MLFQELPALLGHISAYKDKLGLIRITTNGTLVPSGEVLRSAAEHHAVFLISDYGEKSVKMAPLIKALKACRIPFRVAKIAWHECRRIVDGARRREKATEDLYMNCDKLCSTFVNPYEWKPSATTAGKLIKKPKNAPRRLNLPDISNAGGIILVLQTQTLF